MREGTCAADGMAGHSQLNGSFQPSRHEGGTEVDTISQSANTNHLTWTATTDEPKDCPEIATTPSRTGDIVLQTDCEAGRASTAVSTLDQILGTQDQAIFNDIFGYPDFSVSASLPWGFDDSSGLGSYT